MSDNMFEIDVDNNKNTIDALLGNQSEFFNPEVVDILKMLGHKIQNRRNYVGKNMIHLVLMPFIFNK
jgi:hypothetical protein